MSSKRWPLLLTLLLCLAQTSEAVFLVPGRLTLRQHGRTETFGVLILLGDYYRDVYGLADVQQQLLLGTEHVDSKAFVQEYLALVQDWYFQQMARHPQVYGPNLASITQGLSELEPIQDGLSSAVIVTEPESLTHPLALFRVTTQGKDSLVPSQRHFLGKGLNPAKISRAERRWDTVVVPDFSDAGLQWRSFPLEFPIQERMHSWWVGAVNELKNWGLEPRFSRRLFPFQYNLAWKFGMFTYGANQTLVSKVACDCYGQALLEYYNQYNLLPIDTICNEHTQYIPLHFLEATAGMLREGIHDRVIKISKGVLPHGVFSYDWTLAEQLPSIRCVDELLRNKRAKPRR